MTSSDSVQAAAARAWTPTSTALPTRGQAVEWIAPDGKQERGTFAGGLIWFPEGSPMYVYYLPTHWRAAESPSAAQPAGVKT